MLTRLIKTNEYKIAHGHATPTRTLETKRGKGGALYFCNYLLIAF